MELKRRRIRRTAEWAAENKDAPKQFLKRFNEVFPTTIYLTGQERYFIELQTVIHGVSMTEYISNLIRKQMPKDMRSK